MRISVTRTAEVPGAVNRSIKKKRGMKLAPGLRSDWLKFETVSRSEVFEELKDFAGLPSLCSGHISVR